MLDEALPSWSFDGGETGMFPQFRRTKTQNNIFFRHAGFQQNGGDSFLGVVLLNPDFIVNQFQMKRIGMPILFRLPPSIDKRTAAMLVVKNDIGFNRIIAPGTKFGVFP
jgi:hypothetical protein